VPETIRQAGRQAGPVSEIDEVDYYQYASTSDMQIAYGTASDGAFLPGGCASGGEEDGTW